VRASARACVAQIVHRLPASQPPVTKTVRGLTAPLLLLAAAATTPFRAAVLGAHIDGALLLAVCDAGEPHQLHALLRQHRPIRLKVTCCERAPRVWELREQEPAFCVQCLSSPLALDPTPFTVHPLTCPIPLYPKASPPWLPHLGSCPSITPFLSHDSINVLVRACSLCACVCLCVRVRVRVRANVVGERERERKKFY
jgi:hypothetical protein